MEGVHSPHLIYALYINYESDASGAYTVLIGHEQSIEESRRGLPSLGNEEGLYTEKVPGSRYVVFTTNRGPVHQAVSEKWQEIWASSAHGLLKRTFRGDFELYDARSFNPNDATVQIYVAVEEDLA